MTDPADRPGDRFTGAVAIVTGGGSGIGLATLGRHASPDEIANVVAFLASDEAGFVSGSLQLVDGGARTMRYPDILGRLAEASG